MRKLQYITLVLIAMLISTKNIQAQLLSQDPLYQLVFIDDFDSTVLRANKWNTHWPWSKANFPNANKSRTCVGSAGFAGAPSNDTVDIAYTRSAPDDTANRKFMTSGGVTFQRIISKKENFNEGMAVYHYPYDATYCAAHSGYHGVDGNGVDYCYYDSLVPFKFSTAMIFSRYKFKYGYFEMRYRLPDNLPGTWPANYYNAYGPNCWMFGGDSSAVYSELDLFEQRGTDWKMDANFLYRKKSPSGYTGPSDDTSFFVAHNSFPNYYKPYPDQINNQRGDTGNYWFTVGCEWTPNYTDLYYNKNDTVRRFSKSAFPSGLNPISGMTAMSMIVDIYMPSFQYCIAYINGLTQPVFNYDIDYVKVYQINQSLNCPSNSGNFTSFTTNSYVSQLYKDLTVGGSGTAILNSGSYHLAGQNFVTLNGGFEISGGAGAIISTTPCQTDQSKIYDNTVYPNLPSSGVFKDIKSGKTSLPSN